MNQYSNLDRVMGARDHFKNGASLKSHTSSDNFGIIQTLKIVPLALIVTFMACTQPNNTVRGYIEGLSNDTIFVMLVSLDNWGTQEPVQDTVFAKNGQFEYAFPNDGAYGMEFLFPQYFFLNSSGGSIRPNNSRLTIFSEQGDKIIFKGSVNLAGLNNVIVSGSKLNSDFSTIQNKMFDINKNEFEGEMAIAQGEDTGWEKRRERVNARIELFGNFISTNLDNPLSAFLLFRQPLEVV